MPSHFPPRLASPPDGGGPLAGCAGSKETPSLQMRLAHRKGLIRVHTYQHTVSFNCRLGIWTPIKIPARTCFFFSLPLQPPASSLDSETRPPVSTAPPLKDKKKAPKNVCTFTEVLPGPRKEQPFPTPLGSQPSLAAPAPPSLGHLFTSSLAVLRIQKQEIVHQS